MCEELKFQQQKLTLHQQIWLTMQRPNIKINSGPVIADEKKCKVYVI